MALRMKLDAASSLREGATLARRVLAITVARAAEFATGHDARGLRRRAHADRRIADAEAWDGPRHGRKQPIRKAIRNMRRDISRHVADYARKPGLSRLYRVGLPIRQSSPLMGWRLASWAAAPVPDRAHCRADTT